MQPRQRVLVLRASQQAGALSEQLERRGLEPVLLPVLATVPPPSLAALDDALRQMERFDWLLLTSANAVSAVASRLQALERGLPAGLRVAAIGASTANAVEALGTAVDLVPAEAMNESLAAALEPFAQQSDGRPTRMLLPRAEEAREVLPEILGRAGAEVTVVPAYRTVVPPETVERVRQLAADPSGPVAAIAFTSASTARNFAQLFRAAGVAVPQGALRVSIGPITSETLRELGLPPHAEAKETTAAGVAEAVAVLLAGS